MFSDEMIHGRLARAQKIQALSRVAPLNAARTAQARRPYLRWPRMERQTPIVPRAVAEAVWEEASLWLNVELPREWVRRLAVRANVVYRNCPRFRRRIRRGGDSGRDWLWMFARHWLAAMIYERDEALYRRLPSSYPAGGELPRSGRHRVQNAN